MSGVFKVGIIGGTGLEDPQIIQNAEEIRVSTPYGEPSDSLISGTINGVPCVLLSRHGRQHQFSPTTINYRANIWALKKLGASVVIACSACGSLSEDIQPGHVVVLDSFIDRTVKREKTFYDGKKGHPQGVCHVPMHPCYNPKLCEMLSLSAKELGITFRGQGTAVCIEGPAYSSLAESKLYRGWGCHTVNMTLCPEVYLMKELGLPFAVAAIVTDYDCWKEGREPVSVDMVAQALNENVGKTKQLLMKSVELIYAQKANFELEMNDAKRMAREAIMNPGDLSHI